MEHPDITAAQQTGYPRRGKTRHIVRECDSCGEPLNEFDWFIEVGGERLCCDCVENLKSGPEDAIIEMDDEPDWFDARKDALYDGC